MYVEWGMILGPWCESRKPGMHTMSRKKSTARQTSSPGFKNGINWILKCCDFIKKWSLTASQTETTYYENISVSRWHQNVALLASYKNMSFPQKLFKHQNVGLLASYNQENVRPPGENCASRKNQRARNTDPLLVHLPQQNMDYKFEWKDKSLMFSK